MVLKISPIFLIFFVCQGSARTENNTQSEVLRSVKLTVSDGQSAGFLTTNGRKKGDGTCSVIGSSFYVIGRPHYFFSE